MSDFADGIAPQRYYCRRPSNCSQRTYCRSVPNKPSSYGRDRDAAVTAHWSLDEGRWKGSSGSLAGPGAPTPSSAPEANPFIGFKRFVDGKLNALAHGRTPATEVKGERSPSEVAWTRWAGQTVQPESTTSTASSGDSREAARLLLRQAELSTLDVPSHAIRDLFREDPLDYAYRPDSMANAMLAFGGACYFLPEIGDRLPSSKSLFRPAPTPHRWLSADWFQHSPYSPLNVEVDSSLSPPHQRWRAAFEDLMTVALERPLPQPPPFSGGSISEYESTLVPSQPGVDWVFGLQSQGILPPLLPRLLSEQTPRSEHLDFRRGKKDFEQLVLAIETTKRAASVLQSCQDLKDPSSVRSPIGAHARNGIAVTASSYVPNNTRIQGGDASLVADRQTQPDPDDTLPKPAASLLTVQTTSKTTRTEGGKISTKTVVRRSYDDGTEEEWETLHSSNE